MAADSEALRLSKIARRDYDEYVALVLELSPDDFEALCRGVLALLGCEDCVITPSSGDQGLDVIGTLPMEGRLGRSYALGGPDRLMSVKFYGQAKHYVATTVEPEELRAFVGAYEMAMKSVFTDSGAAVGDLLGKPWGAKFLLFMTTGSLSTGAHKLCDQAGIVLLDLDMICALLADHQIAGSDGGVRREDFVSWVNVQR